MKSRLLLLLACVLSPLLLTAPLHAQAAKPPAESGLLTALPGDSISEHTIGEGAERMSYTATAGTLPLLNGKGETGAKVFYVAYTVRGAERPVTFVFNGGPGAASAFLHLGALGPRVLNFTPNGGATVEPVRLADNPDHWLAFTDLVFIDPPGTGYSRAAPPEEGEKAYYGVDKDADAMTDFVRLYLTRNGRSLAPVYLAGESYGGFRAVLMAERLLSSGLQVKGAVLISPALEFSVLRGDDRMLLPLSLDLPSIAASHFEIAGGPDASFEGLREVEEFARTTYLLHLAAGYKRDDAVIAALARFTGLPLDIIARQHGRVRTRLFSLEYQKATGRALSPYDGSVSAPIPRPGENVYFDPILEKAATVLAPAMSAYVRDELGFKTDLPYWLLNRDIAGNWDFGTKPNRQGYAGALDKLQDARTQNPALKILIAHGYTDLVTPYAVSQFLVEQLEPIETAAPIGVRVYRGGHMMYFRAGSRRELRNDSAALYAAGGASKP